MTTVISTLPVVQPAGLKGARIIPRQVDGIPANGLTNLLLMAENPADGLLDRVTGLRYLLDGVGGTAVLQPGGGLKLGGWNAVMGPTVNIDQPFTVAMSYTRDKPAVDRSYRVLIVGGIDLAGFAAREQLLSTDVNASQALTGLYLNRTVNGPSQPGASASLPKPWTARWDRTVTLFFPA